MTGQRGMPERGVGPTLRVVDHKQIPPNIDASLRAACELFRDAQDPLTSISVSGRLPPDEEDLAPMVLAAAERLAVEYELAVDLRFDGAAYEVHFHRRAS